MTRFSAGYYNYSYEVTSDPDRFIVLQPVLGDFSTGVTITVVENWLEEFR